MNVVKLPLRLARYLFSIPLRALHWVSMEVPIGVKEWRPQNLLDKQSRYALLILNQPLLFTKDKMACIWNRAIIRSTADGGTNVWHQFARAAEDHLNNPIPDVITGDFDSIDHRILEFYKGHGAKVIRNPDQDETDFNKCIRELLKELANRETKVDSVIAVCENTGRLDHILSNLNTLYQAPELLGSIPLYLLTSSSITWVLVAGRHKIHITSDLMTHEHCGLIPLGCPANVTTSGLKWDMTSLKLEFSGMISSCNKFTDKDVVTVETDRPILFTMTLPS